MLEFFLGGGAPMLVILPLSLVLIVASIKFASKPRPEMLGGISALAKATLYATLTGVASDVAAVMTKVPQHPEWSKSPEIHLIIMQGLGESMAPAILGFMMLNLAYVLVAVGERRSSSV